MHQLEKD